MTSIVAGVMSFTFLVFASLFAMALMKPDVTITKRDVVKAFILMMVFFTMAYGAALLA